ncbi:MBL fold metallo-hydrolase [Microaerobacter geothermalis]|uniref:MBL fold metallo-hydrolase RNA specificity domain-containing protein n=1 Tax=Microaerobacter geothermalis TaxID=674972 RepID=UPI001F36D07A|nr:MBL fold metallo-hydrolase [Microaerobacter geothermalis]MCF6092976.1 MBL fold metallo-hydrolase [Microaerobacter geothermalis]
MKITFLGGAGTVTGSCYLLEIERDKVLVDCGMFQGSKEMEGWNFETPISPNEISTIILTHAHIDHSGLIPRLYKLGFRGKVLATKSTVELCKVMLPDSGHIQEMEIEWKNRKRKRKGKKELEPLYTQEEAERSLHLFHPLPYHTVVEISPHIRIRFRDAGHILGSAIVEVWINEKEREYKLLFSGDLGNPGQAIVRDPEYGMTADYVFIESTYGGKLHPPREDEKKRFVEIIHRMQKEGGNIIIPSFAVGRTQEILYLLNELFLSGEIKPFPVFIDSPLAVKATEVFHQNQQSYDEESKALLNRGIDPIAFPGLQYVRTPQESQALNKVTSGIMIISASGMCEAGRIKHHLKHNLWISKSQIVFVGYQAKGTLGRKILDGSKRVRIFGEDVKVNAMIHNLEGFSAHADQNGLIHWISQVNSPRKVFVVHGEGEQANLLAKRITEELAYSTHIPKRGEVFHITEDLSATIENMDVHQLGSTNQLESANPIFHMNDAEIQSIFLALQQNVSSFEKMMKRLQFTSEQRKWILGKLEPLLHQLSETFDDLELGEEDVPLDRN